MPRSRTYTNVGYVEIQWSKGGLVCLVSGTYPVPGRAEETMHQFTREDAEALGDLVRTMRRAKKQAHEAPSELGHRAPCVAGEVCGDPHHCPPLD